MDIVFAAYTSKVIAWLENDGASDPSWTGTSDGPFVEVINGAIVNVSQRNFVAQEPTSNPKSVFAADFDGDGDLDIVSASSYSGKGSIAWYENKNGDGYSWTTNNLSLIHI